jgi:hypothetical protein
MEMSGELPASVPLYWISIPMYEVESVSSQMDIKRTTCDIQTWEQHLFLDISSTNTDTLVASLY